MAYTRMQSSRASNNSRHQKRFVPKPSAAESTSTTDAGLRDGAPLANSSGPLLSLSSSLRGRSPTKIRKQGNDGNFVNYLPQDEAVASGIGSENGGLDADESQRVVDLLNAELVALLTMNPRDFWREVASNGSLHQFLDSYLLFRNRWYDFPHRGMRGTVAGVIVGELELCRRVFMVLYRMSSNRDPGAKVSECLSAKEHTALLQEKKLLDLPKLLDICSIYGCENADLTRSLVINAIKSQPGFPGYIRAVVSHFLGIVHTMHERCSSFLEVLMSDEKHEDHWLHQIFTDFLEVIDFINDAIVTLDAFSDAYEPAAMYFSEVYELSGGQMELLNTLEKLHDSLLPSLHNGFSIASNLRIKELVNLSNDAFLSFKVLSTRLVKFGWKLLDSCYLRDVVMQGFSLQTATKIFPTNVEDPAIRGDILVETLKGICGEVSSYQGNHNYGSFLHNMEGTYQMLSRIISLRKTGWIIMDEEQFHYISKIVSPTPFLHPLDSINNGDTNEDGAIQESKISQIKDIFPEYGEGFLSACLEAYDQNPEEVIRRILEGTLHEDLLSLNKSTTKSQLNKPISDPRHDKGKSLLLESRFESSEIEIPGESMSSSKSKDKGKGKLIESTSRVSPFIDSSTRETNVSSSYSSSGRFIRKSREETLDSEVLDSLNAKDTARASVLASVSEYEDEYDDSFDELGLGVVESRFEETESFGEQLSSSSSSLGKSWESQKKPQFYVKDGKNYSYKVSGSVAVSSAGEAAVVNQAEKELIHGLGRGGNFPVGAVSVLRDAQQREEGLRESGATVEASGRGQPHRGRSGPLKMPRDTEERGEEAVGGGQNTGRGYPNVLRGRGGRRGGGRYHQKDRAMKKHFSGLGGY